MKDEDVKVTYVDDDNNEYEENYSCFHIKKGNRLANKISSALFPTCLLAFLALGLFWNMWGKAWIVFLAIPIYEVFMGAINRSGKKKIMFITLLLCIAGYIFLVLYLPTVGITAAWLKSLIVFLVIPIMSALVK